MRTSPRPSFREVFARRFFGPDVGILSVILVVVASWETLGAASPSDFAERVVEGARVSIEKRPPYDPSYVKIPYPGGDPGWRRGACVEVVIRAFRHAGVDLQERVHEDIVARPRAYGLKRPDPNLDHRRVRNLKVFFEEHATRVPLSSDDWRAGDIAVWDLYGGTAPNHIGIISDRKSREGTPLVIHHFTARAGFTGYPSEDDCLRRWRLLAHFRWAGEDVGASEAGKR